MLKGKRLSEIEGYLAGICNDSPVMIIAAMAVAVPLTHDVCVFLK